MNKYDKCYKENETSKYKKLKLLNLNQKIQIYSFFESFYGEEYTKRLFSNSANGIVYDVVFGLDFFCDIVQKFVRDKIIINLNKGGVIQIFIENLCDAYIRRDYNYIDRCMKSFKATGLIKDIKLADNIFIIEKLDGKKVMFFNSLKTEEEVKKNEGQCHKIGNYLINKENANKVYCVTILETAIYGETRYHTFMVYDRLVHDFARNFIMLYDDYKELFDFKVLSYVRGDILKKNIERLSKKDKEFNKSNKHKVLKYAMYKQMKDNK